MEPTIPGGWVDLPSSNIAFWKMKFNYILLTDNIRNKNKKKINWTGRYSYIGFILAFTSSIHNKQPRKVKTQHVVKSRGQHCGDIELAGYLANESGPVPLVMDLRIAQDRVGSSADPTLMSSIE